MNRRLCLSAPDESLRKATFVGAVEPDEKAKERPVRPKKNSTRLPATHRLVRVTLKKTTERALFGWGLVAAFLSERVPTLAQKQYALRISLLSTLPRGKSSPVTVVTKIANAIPIFVCLLVRHYRVDAPALPLVCFAPHCGSRIVFCHAQRTLW